MRVALFTPLSPLKTAIADHSEGLLPHLSKLVDIDLYIDDNYHPNNPEITKHFTIRSFHEFPSRADQYDALLYAMGDHAGFHGYMYPLLQQFPGVVILHDTTLHRAIIHLTSALSKPELYLKELRYAYGIADISIAQRILSGFGETLVKRYPLFERVVDHSLGIIVHNEHARQQVLCYCPEAQVTQINQHFFLPPGYEDCTLDMGALRAQWGLEGRFVIGSCGILVPDKRIDICLRAFTRFLTHHPDAAYFFVGNYPARYDLPGIIHKYDLDDHVRITGWMDPIAFTQHMQLLDLGVHLRYPHIGGTPFTPFRMMGLGIPTLISDIEPLADLPEGTCVKVMPDEFEEETLFELFSELADNEGLRCQIGENGAHWIREHHDAAQIAAQYIQVIENAISGFTSRRPFHGKTNHATTYLIQETADLIYNLGISLQDDESLQFFADAVLNKLT
ncbi:MAG: glycosyltransferase family 4 protein [Anaerolineales bacterium]|nr:glycosyltransferase family 4 protein [Anaerolineales bacterium]